MNATAELTSIATEHVFDYHAPLARPFAVGRHPYGTRLSYQLGEGRLRGPRLSGEILDGGGVQWAVIDDDGWVRSEVRGQCRTDDGALLYFVNSGLIEPSRALAQAIARGRETGYEDHYWRASIRVETGDRRYRWLTQSALIARGRICAGPGVEYQVFRVC